MLQLTTSTPAGRAERVRWWIRNGYIKSAKDAVRLGRTVGIDFDESVSVIEEWCATLEKRIEYDRAARRELAKMKARSGRY